MANDDTNLGADEKYSTVNADSSIGFLIDLISGVFGGCAGVLGTYNLIQPKFALMFTWHPKETLLTLPS
jgi:hypothetical protein